MKLRIKQLVSLKEANQNFSRVARKVDEEGYVLLLRNNKPTYLVFAYDEDDIVADDSSLLDALHRLIERKKSAKLKKKGEGEKTMDKKTAKERRRKFADRIEALYRDSRNATKKYVESLIYPDGKAHISVDLTNVDELYSPYSYKEDMKPDIFEYIDEKTYYTPVEIPLIVNFDVGDVSDLRKSRIKKSFLDHYRLIYEDKRRELKINRAVAWVLFAIGMIALVISTIAKLAMNAAQIPDIPLIFEMLQIFSWVFLWESISKFFFQGREMRIQCMNAGQLALAEVKFNEPEPELKDNIE